MKKVISIGLLVMLMAFVLPDVASVASAMAMEEYAVTNTLPANARAKYYTYIKNENVTDEQFLNYFVIQNDDACDGSNSMLINGNVDKTLSQQISMFPSISPSASNITGTYTASFKTKTILKKSNFNGFLTIKDKSENNIIRQEIQSLTPSGPDEYGWYTYTMSGDALTYGATKAELKIIKAVAPIRFDDFRLTMDGIAENYIINGSFEELAVEELPNNTLPGGAVLTANGVPDYQVANYYTVSTSDATDGSTSLKIFNEASWTDKEVSLRINFNKALPFGTYKLSLNSLRNGTNKVCISAIGASGKIDFEEKAYADDGTNIGSGWKAYSTYVTADDAISGIEIKTSGTADILIDELSLKDDYNKEYIENGSFENYTVKEYIISDLIYDATTGTTELYVANNNCNTDMNVALITVINPNGDIEQIKDFAAIDFAIIKKGTHTKISATLTAKPVTGDKVRAFVWDRNTLEPYIDAKTLN